jgi:hypothetical protein
VIKKAVCDPLSAFKEQQRKDHKGQQAAVEKSLKTLLEISALAAKVAASILMCFFTSHLRS